VWKEIAGGAGLAVVLYLAIQGYNILPIIFLVALMYVLMQATGLKGISRRFATVVPASVTTVTFKDVGGQGTAKKELVEALDFIKRDDLARKLGIRPIKGILLTGPPGTGKTLLAKAAANYTDSAFIATSGSEFIEVYAGVGAQRVRELFRNARETARASGKKGAIIFIDEIEVLGGRRGQNAGHLEYDQTINQLLVEMDGLSPADDVKILVVGATNRADLLDPAILRPGRFDRIVRVDLPDKEGRLQILGLHTRNKPLAEGIDLDKIARETFGFSGAHLESLANEAAILAMREGKEVIEQRHFEEAIEKVIMGEKLERRPNPEDLKRVAVHEAGHAIVGETLRPGTVSSITISPRGGALGYVRNSPRDEQYIFERRQIEEEIAILIAGAIAEEVFSGSRSTGSSEDFERAVHLARRIILAGMSPYGIVDPQTISSEMMSRGVNNIVGGQERRVRSILARYGSLLERVSAALLEKERLSGDELRLMMGRAEARETALPIKVAMKLRRRGRWRVARRSWAA